MKLLKLIYFTHLYVEIIFREDQLLEIITLFESQHKYYKVYDLDYVPPYNFGLDPINVPHWAKKSQKLDTL